ncbi:phosphatidate cytidylyltransferase [Aquamicrobium ahrensii]|uniref:Phosphatidate cytidylyltransferase n=1 Tax=Aquamicrobium ahrensii TaxID=469551 RepID=A0ABV2KG58_9HYPH
MSNLQLRIISGLVLAVAVLTLTWIGGLPFRLFAVLIAGAVFYEWTRMTRPAHLRSMWLMPEACMAILLIALGFGVSAGSFLLLALAATVIVAALGFVRGSGSWEAAGVAYASLSGFALAFLRGDDQAGLLAILFLFAVVWTTDTLAYFVGRSLGGPKLAPAISPGKTWSGAVGGTVAGLAAGVIVSFLAGTGNHLLLGLAALLLSVVSQIGDLFESWVKRRHGCKDSSQLIPGHGGVMDRVDGLVVAALALYVIGSVAASADNPAQGLFGG